MTNVQDTINAFMEAAAAHQREPGHLATIDSLRQTVDKAQRHSQELEVSAVSYRATIRNLEDRVRSLEVERDDASFRLLEAEDRASKLAATASDLLGNMRSVCDDYGSMLAALEPSKPQPESVEGQKLQLEAQSPVVVEEPKPSENFDTAGYRVDPVTGEGTGRAMGVQEPHPVQATGEPAPKPYEGKNWSEVWPRVLTYDTWVDGGGNYDGWVN